MRRPTSRLSWSLLGGVVVADVAFLWSLEQHPALAPAARVCGWLAVLGPLVVPAYPALRTRLRVPEILTPVLLGVQLLVLLGLREAGPISLALALLVITQTHLWLRSRSDAAAGWCLACSPLIVTLAMAGAASPVWGALFPLSLFCAAVAALGLQERSARRDEEGSSLRRRFGADGSAPAARHALHWVGYALPLSVVILGSLCTIFLLALALPKPWQAFWDLRPSQRAPTDWKNDFVVDDEGEPRPRDPLRQTFPSELTYSGGVSQPVETDIMEVRPVSGSADGAAWRKPIYLRGRVMDTFTSDGALFGAKVNLEPFEDAQDGRVDGWTQLEELASWEPEVELAIRQQPLLAEGGEFGLLFAPEPIRAVRAPGVLWDRSGLLLTREPAQDWFEYRVRFTDRRLAEERVRKARAIYWDGRYRQLPQENEGFRWVAGQAREITRGAASDFERVSRVVDYFKDNFDYSLKSTDFPGLIGVVDFLERRRGHCTYFATAAVLMLRSVDIPCRIATGFITAEWSQVRSAFPITRQNGHAWIEVYFRDIGWVSFDPTPMRRRAAAFAALARKSRAGLSDWMTGVLDEFAQWTASGGDVIYFESLLGALSEGPRALMRSMDASSTILWGVLASFVTATAMQLGWRSLRRGSKRRKRRAAEPSSDAYARLLRALAKHGFHKPPTHTPREFARSVAAAGGTQFGAVRPLTERFYRVRFGGAPWGDAEESALADFLQRIRG